MSIIPSRAPSVAVELATTDLTPPRSIKAARDFEAHLIGSLLESLERTFAAVPGKEAITGADDYQHMATQALAQSVAAKGGMGVGAMIARYLAAQPANEKRTALPKGDTST